MTCSLRWVERLVCGGSPRLLRGGLVLVLATVLAACGGAESTAPPDAQAAGAAALPDKRAAAADPSAFGGNGWYWNPAESGTGFMFEAQGSRAFVAFFMYDEATGNPIWYAAYGDLVRDAASGSFAFSGDLRVYRGGLGISAVTRLGPGSTSVGPLGIAFVGGKATVSLPGGRVMAAQRYIIDDSGYDFANPSPPRANQPEVGWYWNPDEGGRGYAIEVQNDKVFMAMFHYNPDGSPTWNIVQGDIRSGTVVERFELYMGGQGLASAHRTGSRALLLPSTLSFHNPCAGQLQLYGAPPIALRRFSIDGSTQPPGSECHAVATAPDVNEAGSTDPMEPGDAVFGLIDRAGDVDGYRIALVAGTTYTFDLYGAGSRSGTLADPVLILHDQNFSKLTENDDRDPTSTEARISHTATYTGTHFLQAKASSSGTGSYRLTSSGVAANLARYEVQPVSSYAGTATGRLRGTQPATLSLAIAAGGELTGTLRFDAAPDTPVTLTGTVSAGGALVFGTGAPRDVGCTAFVAGTGFFGSCGTAGMVEGSWAPVSVRTGRLGAMLECLDKGSRVKLVVNGANPVTVTGDGSCTGRPFVLSTTMAHGEFYEIAVASQPSAPDLYCRIAGRDRGVFSGDIAVATVNCAPVDQRRTVGGTVSGLKGGGLVLKRSCSASEACANGGTELAVPVDGPFLFTGLKSGDSYAITVAASPATPAQTCSVGNGTGTVLDSVSGIAVVCRDTPAFSLGGLISGLTGTGLVLGRGEERLQIPANGNGQFAFAVPMASGAGYTVTVLNQPSNPAQLCQVSGGSGSMVDARVDSVVVACAIVPPQAFTIGGVVSGVAGSGLVLVNDGVELAVVNGSFTLPFSFASASRYTITVKTQPTGPDQLCSVVGGAGTVNAANVGNVVVNCPPVELLTAVSVSHAVLKLKADQTADLLVSVVNPPASGAPFTATSAQRCAQVGTTATTVQLTGRATPSGHCREELTITSGTARRTVTVHVYDPMTMDIGGGLLIRYASSYDFRWNDSGSGGSESASFHHPVADVANGWFAIGGYALGDYSDVNKGHPIIVVKDTSAAQDLLADVSRWEPVWNTSGMDSDVLFGTVWKPVCPAGYTSLGSLFWSGAAIPFGAIKCVAQRFTVQGTLGARVYSDAGTGADGNLSVWNVGPPLVGVKEGHAAMTARALVGCPGDHGGTECDLASFNLLLIPMTVAERRDDAGQEPQLTGYFPLQILSTRFSSRVRVPFTMVPSEDPKCGTPACANASGRVASNLLRTPFYYIAREESYADLIHHRNLLDQEVMLGPFTQSLGWDEERSKSFTQEVGMEIGVEVKFVSASINTQLSWTQSSTQGTNGSQTWTYGPYPVAPGAYVQALKVDTVFRAISEDGIALSAFGGSTTGSITLQWPLRAKRPAGALPGARAQARR